MTSLNLSVLIYQMQIMSYQPQQIILSINKITDISDTSSPYQSVVLVLTQTSATPKALASRQL